MRIKTREELRKEGRKLPAMPPVSIRLQPELWEKCSWAAHEMGVDRSEFVRIALTRATSGVKPPKSQDLREIAVADDEWQQWKDVAAQHRMPLDKLITKVMRKLADSTFSRG